MSHDLSTLRRKSNAKYLTKHQFEPFPRINQTPKRQFIVSKTKFKKQFPPPPTASCYKTHGLQKRTLQRFASYILNL